MPNAISVVNVSKCYQIGHATQRRAQGSLREDLTSWLKFPWRWLSGMDKQPSGATSQEEFWALKGIDFAIQEGETVGVVGDNGAGKSTLLKILSRITFPTTGHVEMHGRASSLLEVGSGFHQELTGRENIYLNGAIIGMTRAEITRKFDAIVEFAEISQFLDTPIKRYSSGMHVRLAFAVAAHLDPEILILDEVLAVGDAGFQAKCSAKMQEVARAEGRTILCVSHNRESILRICQRTLILEKGKLIFDGPAEEGMALYRSGSPRGAANSLQSWGGVGYRPLDDAQTARNGNQSHEGSASGHETAILLRAACRRENGMLTEQVAFGEPFIIYMRWHHAPPVPNAFYGIRFFDAYQRLYTVANTRCQEVTIKEGTQEVFCRIDPNLLKPGRYSISIGYYDPPRFIHHVDPCLILQVESYPHRPEYVFNISLDAAFKVPTTWREQPSQEEVP